MYQRCILLLFFEYIYVTEAWYMKLEIFIHNILNNFLDEYGYQQKQVQCKILQMIMFYVGFEFTLSFNAIKSICISSYLFYYLFISLSVI